MFFPGRYLRQYLSGLPLIHSSPTVCITHIIYTQEGERAFDHLQSAGSSEDLNQAVQHKDKLLEFDQTKYVGHRACIPCSYAIGWGVIKM